MEAERRLLARAQAAGDEAASLRARLAEAEAEAAALRARAERLEREAAERDELLTALLAATSRAGDSGGGPLLRACDGEEEEEERARHDARGEQEHEQDPLPAPWLDHAADTTDAEALAAAAALYAQQRQKHDDDFYTAATAASGMPPWMEMDRSKGWQVCDTTKSCLPFSTFYLLPASEWKGHKSMGVDCFIIAF